MATERSDVVGFVVVCGSKWHPFIIELMAIAHRSNRTTYAWVLNCILATSGACMLNQGLTRSIKSLLRVRQNRANGRKVMLSGILRVQNFYLLTSGGSSVRSVEKSSKFLLPID